MWHESHRWPTAVPRRMDRMYERRARRGGRFRPRRLFLEEAEPSCGMGHTGDGERQDHGG